MKRFGILLVAFCLIVSMGIVGCTQKAANSQEAIQQSKDLKTVEEQVNYLVKQANAFVSSKEFDQAIATARHILSNLDQDSAEAKSIIEKAKAELAKAAQGALDDAKSALGSLGK